MNTPGPRTTREALIAEMLGDLDNLLDRVEAVPHRIAEAEEKMLCTSKALDASGDKYREAVVAFTEKAKAELADYLDKKAGATVEEQWVALQEAARAAFRSEASDKAENLGEVLSVAAQEFRRSGWYRLVEHGITAFIASGLTVALVLTFIKH